MPEGTVLKIETMVLKSQSVEQRLRSYPRHSFHPNAAILALANRKCYVAYPTSINRQSSDSNKN